MSKMYGFRVYIVQAFPNKKSGKDALDVSEGSHAHNEIVELLEQLKRRGTVFFPAPAPLNGEPAKPATSMTVNSCEVVRSDLIHTSVSMGITGSHARATRPQKKKAKQLKNWSPEAEHFVTFIFPQGPEDRFLMVVQTIRRSDPTRQLLRLLTGASMQRREDAKVTDKAKREAARSRGAAVPKAQTFYRLVFDAKQAADNRYVDEVLSNAERAKARFVSKVPSDRGSSREVVRRELSISLRNDEVQEIGRNVSRRWASRSRAGKATSHREGVSELSDELVSHNLLEDDEGGRYEQATLTVVDKNNDSTTIAVDTLKDVFTYPVSDGPPSAAFHYGKMTPRVKVIAQDERLEITDVDADEVAEWLTDSIPAP